MNAYMVMVEEAIEQLPDPDTVTHVFMQGGSAASPRRLPRLRRRSPRRLPRFVVVEPVEADCLQQSARAGRPTPSSGSLHTVMAGLACREVSPAAWKILDWLASDYVTIADATAIEAMQLLARGDHDVPIVSGESAAAEWASSSPPPPTPRCAPRSPWTTAAPWSCSAAKEPRIRRPPAARRHDARDVFERQALQLAG